MFETSDNNKLVTPLVRVDLVIPVDFESFAGFEKVLAAVESNAVPFAAVVPLQKGGLLDGIEIEIILPWGYNVNFNETKMVLSSSINQQISI